MQAFDVAYFAVSVDAPETNRRFAESLGATYPILSDPSRRVARAYGVLGPFGMAHRWTYYIGPDGRLREVDKKISTATAGHDVAGRLGALGVPARRH